MKRGGVGMSAGGGCCSRFHGLLGCTIGVRCVPGGPLLGINGFGRICFRAMRSALRFCATRRFGLFVATTRQRVGVVDSCGFCVFFGVTFCAKVQGKRVGTLG